MAYKHPNNNKFTYLSFSRLLKFTGNVSSHHSNRILLSFLIHMIRKKLIPYFIEQYNIDKKIFSQVIVSI